ncbi:MAG TPA: protein translocase subunit SecD [Longimicrobiaceae bacterium]|nr:protein translocase subunit SecD [Longimicrobiaceae bacterium]
MGLILVCVLLSVFFLYRNYMREDAQGKPTRDIVTLGLDLQGGTHLKLEIDESKARLSPEQRADAIERALKVVRMRIDQLGVGEHVVQKSGDSRIIVELPGIEKENRAKEILQRTAFLEFQVVRPLDELNAALPRIERAIVAAFPNEGRQAERQQSTVGGLFKNAPADSAGADSAAATLARPFQSKLTRLGSQGQMLVAVADTQAVSRYLRHPEVQRLLPRGTTLAWGVAEAEEQAGFASLWLLEADPIMTGQHLQNALAQTDQFGRPIVVFELSRRGGRTFGRETAAHIGDQMAIVLDDRVYTAPVIRGQITTNGQIELGNATMEDATDLALVLRAGALPAPLKIVEERTIGPTLGQDSIDNGMLAGMIGVTAVVVMILLYYKLAGVFAVIALGLYVLFILGALAALPGAALTFPGMAGLVLSVGMAVDANVLIFERIREELAAGRAVRPAVQEGFKNALSAIVDSNLTTLITAGILYYIGSGPVQGFGVTLAIGIVASMFTAIFVTRTLFLVYLERRSPAAQGLSI